MSDVLVAIVGAVGLLSVALVANRGRQHAKAAREQVENDHATNLRVEGDDRHTEILQRLEGLASDIRGVRRDIGRIDERVIELERTQPRPPIRRKRS